MADTIQELPKHCGPAGADACKYCGRRRTDSDVARCVDAKAAYERSVVRLDGPSNPGPVVDGVKMAHNHAELVARARAFFAPTTPTPTPRLVPDRPSDAAIAAVFWQRWISATIHVEAAYELQRMHDDAREIDAAAPPAEAPAERGDSEKAIAALHGIAAELAYAHGLNQRRENEWAERIRAAITLLAAATAAPATKTGDCTVNGEYMNGPEGMTCGCDANSACAICAPAAPAPDTRVTGGREECAHDDTVVSYDHVRCKRCQSIRTDSRWGIASHRWFESYVAAEFYKKNGRLPEKQA